MVLEGLGKSLRDVLNKVAKAGHVDEQLVKEVSRDIQRALLQGDVNVKLVLNLTKELERRALEEKPPAGMSIREHLVKIIYEELVKILGKKRTLDVKRQKIMMVGLYGQGKTTHTGKLAYYFNKKGMTVGLIAADVHRPAAYDQLAQLGEKIGVPVFGDPKAKSAPDIVRKGLEQFHDRDVIIIDTSGRHSLEDDLIKEIKAVDKVADPDERVLILDASTGQQAGPQAKAFHDAVGVTSVILTKMDGTAKGGGALSAVAQTDASIVFMGTGEHLRDLEPFEPARFISRLLGMGDIQTLMEKAQESMDKEKALETTKKIMGGKFTLKEMYEQMEMLTNMGPLQKIVSMIPGMPGLSEKVDLEASQDRLYKYRIILDSMTDEEMENPKIIKFSRVIRIARGSGVDPRDVRDLLRQYNTSKKVVKGFMGNRKLRKQMLKQLQAGGFEDLEGLS
jgi:signal recognition particle subunit SRP54